MNGVTRHVYHSSNRDYKISENYATLDSAFFRLLFVMLVRESILKETALFLISIFCLLLFRPSAIHAQNLADVVQRAKPGVVTITSDRAGKPIGIGSGFAVREDGILTSAWHVVRHSHNPGVQSNPSYCFRDDESEPTDVWLQQIQILGLKPNHPDYYRYLAYHYEQFASHQKAPASTLSYRQAYKYSQKAIAGTSDRRRKRDMMMDAAQWAFLGALFDQTRSCAEDLLEYARRFPKDSLADQFVYIGYITLGRLSLREGEIEEAKRRLLAAGKIKWPGFGRTSYIPDMSLAKELLKQGQEDTVWKFLVECRTSWRGKDRVPQVILDILEGWIAQMQVGRMPDFDNFLAALRFKQEQQESQPHGFFELVASP
jgi:hypothetical protein